MKTATAHLKSVSPMCQGAPMATPKDRDETHAEYEERCWKERAHVNDDGNVFIPPTAFKNCLQDAAKYKGIQIPGKGKERYTKHFEAGVMVVDPMVLPVMEADIEKWRHFVPADGKPGGSKRVWKNFPIFREWEGEVPFLVFDETINEEVFLQHIEDAGQFIGIGSFRPRNRGFFGRFEVVEVKWS